MVTVSWCLGQVAMCAFSEQLRVLNCREFTCECFSGVIGLGMWYRPALNGDRRMKNDCMP